MTAFRPTGEVLSWGRVTRGLHQLAVPAWPEELAPAIAEAAAFPAKGLAIGLSRSYGDSGLNPGGAVIRMTGLDRVHAFDRQTGLLRADAGLSLGALIGIALRHGFFPPVVPGTRFVTLGGAVANDIHGKNHHGAGTFGRHVARLGLRRTDGSVHELAPGDVLFDATIGGLGLTGVIDWVELQLQRVDGAWLDAQDIAIPNLDAFFDLSMQSEGDYAHTVAWVDCSQTGRSVGKGIFSRANWRADLDCTVHAAKPKLTLPIDAPGFAINPLTLKAFNALYYGLKAGRGGIRRTHYAPFFFPLDSLGGLNRVYGPRGFFQYQCVLPPAAARGGVRALLGEIARSGQGSVLAVLKTFGAVASPGLLSFPMEGATLALDFANKGDDTLGLLARLDAIVREGGGRLYPAKDGRISAAMFAAGYPNLDLFRRHVDPGLSSGFWRRVSA